MASWWKSSGSIYPEKSAAKSVAVASFPSLTLLAISQADAALTISVFFVSAIVFRAARVSAGSSESHQSKACVSRSARNWTTPSLTVRSSGEDQKTQVRLAIFLSTTLAGVCPLALRRERAALRVLTHAQ